MNELHIIRVCTCTILDIERFDTLTSPPWCTQHLYIKCVELCVRFVNDILLTGDFGRWEVGGGWRLRVCRAGAEVRLEGRGRRRDLKGFVAEERPSLIKIAWLKEETTLHYPTWLNLVEISYNISNVNRVWVEVTGEDSEVISDIFHQKTARTNTNNTTLKCIPHCDTHFKNARQYSWWL